MQAIMTLNLVASRGDKRGFLKACADNGIDTVRFGVDTLIGNGDETNPLNPFKAVGTWNPMACVGRDGPDIEIVDLGQWEPLFWDGLTEVIGWMAEFGLAPWFFFEDRCSEVDENWHKFLNVFYGNIQQFPGWNIPGYYAGGVHPAHPGGIQAINLNRYHEAMESKVMDICRAAGITKVYAEPKNEYGYEPGPAYTINDMLEWFRLRCEHLRSLGYIVIGSDREPLSRDKLILPFVDLYDQHGVGETFDLDTMIGTPPLKTIINSDGWFRGQEPPFSWAGIGNQSAEQLRQLGETAVRRGFAGVCVLPQSQIDVLTIDGHDVGWNLDRIDWTPIRAGAEAGGWKPPEPEPEPEPPEPPIPPPPPPKPPEKPCSYFLKRLNIWHWLRCVFLGKH